MSAGAGAASAAAVAGIRPLERVDIPQVASLFELAFGRSRSRAAPPGLGAQLERVFLDHPWADPEIPSLVAEADGRVVGFVGSHVRRLRFDGRPIRMACSGSLMTDPEVRHRALGAFLLHRYLAGPQDLTLTDSANRISRLIWERFGGEVLHLSRVRWVRLLRPVSAAVAHAGALRLLPRPLLRALDAAAAGLPGAPFRAERPAGEAEPLTPAALVDNLPGVAGPLRLYPDYDPPFLEWLFRELGATSRGALLARLVRGGHGRVLGWYVGHLKPGGFCRVLQIAAQDADLGDVMRHLFYQAREQGATGVHGWLEPRLLEALSRRDCLLFTRAGPLTLVHSRSAELLRAVRSDRALLTRLEGDGWMEFPS